MRRINEDRIRRLCVFRQLIDGVPEHVTREAMIREMGEELARKLAEHQKFKKSGNLISAQIDVIVPETPEEGKWP